MASDGGFRRAHLLDALLQGSPSYWLAVFALAAPWVRFTLGPWTLYPGHVAVALLLAAVVLEAGGWTALLRPLAPLLALGGYVAALAALRGEYLAAGAMVGATALNLAWGAAAFRAGVQGDRLRGPREALPLLLGATLLAGLVAWAAQAWWPAACRVLNCAERALWPYAFTGGWGTPAAYTLLLLFLLPAVGGGLLAGVQVPRGPGRRALRGLLGLTAAAGLALVAGAALWSLALVAAGWLLLHRAVGDGRRGPLRLLLRGLAAAGAFTLVLVYGLQPGYVQRLTGDGGALPSVAVRLAQPAPRLLSSDAATPLALTVRNAGWSTLGAGTRSTGTPGAGNAHAGAPLRVEALLLVTPERGATRTLTGTAVALSAPLAPGESRALTLPVRLPPWVREGYLTWQVRLADGRTAPLASGSHPGFRFTNTAYRSLARTPENRLSALAHRARAFEAETRPPPAVEPSAHTAGMVLGDMLDTLFFSPLWGEPQTRGGTGLTGADASRALPFSTVRPFLPELVHRYGLIGLALALLAGWRLLQRAVQCARPGDPAWLLLPIALVLLAAAGLFTPALGSYHAHWAFFLLAGYLEGRYARTAPRPVSRPAPHPRLRLPLPWRSPRRGHARRVRR